MKVCILGKSDTPVSRLAQYLVENTHDVHLVSGLLEEEPPAGVRLHRIEMKGLSLFGAARKVRHIVSQVQPDVVHAFYLTSYGYLASALKDVPVLATAMGTDVFGAPELNRLLSPLRRRMALRAVGRADKIHSVAEHMTERLVQLGAAPFRIATFPRGVPLERFRARGARPSPVPPYRVICNRRMEPVYDHHTLLEAMSVLVGRSVPVLLEAVGRGSLRHVLWAQTRRLGLEGRVRFEGPIEEDRMAERLRSADLFVTPSHSDGTSSCLLEAMASGCIPVATDITANRPWIENGRNGFLFAPGSAAGLAEALERAIASRERWTEIAEHNRRRIERDASMENGCARVLTLYREIMEERSGSRYRRPSGADGARHSSAEQEGPSR